MRLIDIEPFEKNIEGVDCFHNCVLHFTEFHHTHVNCAHLDTKDIPTVEVEPVRHGRWIERKSLHAEGDISAKCSACKKDVQYLGNPLNYCPNCGARMDGESE